MFRPILPPYKFEVEPAPDRGYHVVIPVAGTEDAIEVVCVVCNLCEIEVYSSQYWEFTFAVWVYFMDGRREPFQTQDRQIAAAYLPLVVRRFVMSIVSDGLWKLVNHVGAPRVYGVTREQHPPENSLRRYLLLTRKLQSHGYILEKTGNDPLGRVFWTMHRGPT